MLRKIGFTLLCAVSMNAQIFIFGDVPTSPVINTVPFQALEAGNVVFTSISSENGGIKSLTDKNSVPFTTLLPKSRYLPRSTGVITKPTTKVIRVHNVKSVQKTPMVSHPSQPQKADVSKYLLH